MPSQVGSTNKDDSAECACRADKRIIRFHSIQSDFECSKRRAYYGPPLSALIPRKLLLHRLGRRHRPRALSSALRDVMSEEGRTSMRDLPDGVVARIFAHLFGSTDGGVLTGRAASRIVAARSLACTCRRYRRVFLGLVRGVRLDGAENPWYDGDARLAAVVRLWHGQLRELSLRWFERATLRPALDAVVGAPHLRALSLHGTSVGVSCTELARILDGFAAQLESVSLVSLGAFRGTTNADSALLALGAGCKRLASFELGGTTALSHHALAAVWAGAGPALTSVELHDVQHKTLGDATLLELAARCPSLTSLNVTALHNLSSHALQRCCAAVSGTLSELCVEAHNPHHDAVSDYTAAHILASCSNLTSICFSKPAHYAAVRPLTARWAQCAALALGPRLRKLSVFDPPFFADPQLHALVTACPSLESLGLRACSQVTSCAFARACAALPLRSIDISGSSGICDVGVRALASCRGRQLEFAWLAALPQLSLSALSELLRNSGNTLKDLNVAACARIATLSAVDVIREHLSGPVLECVVLDNMVDTETTYEVVRQRRPKGCGGGGASTLHRQLDLLRNDCPNVVIVLERCGPQHGGGNADMEIVGTGTGAGTVASATSLDCGI